MSSTTIIPGFAALVREFFCQRLIAQQNASARTVASPRPLAPPVTTAATFEFSSMDASLP